MPKLNAVFPLSVALLLLAFSGFAISNTSLPGPRLSQSQVYQGNGLTLFGELTQGTLLRGKVASGDKVWLNDKAVQVATSGFFALGFNRDAELKQTVKWTHKGQTHQHDITLTQRDYKIQKIEGLPPKMVTPPESVLKRIREDNQAVAKARKLRDDRIDFMQDFIWPATGPISGVYGSQRVLNGKPKRPHFGVDVAGPVGQPVYAPADGIVTLYHPDMYYSGGTLIIDHGHGITSTFLHLSKGHVKAGQKVKQGELIAEIGATGRVTGAHLDWRMNWLNQRVDPTVLVPDMPNSAQ
ncbi:M23 family metallopeptidase [Alteromonas sp. a30]|uniref:M23 family metallopeptidase n=1 Tax=Alteromonas sp. a30 TaxID=2730917 RepID=UPI0022821726|nr:M23 family metallopeptidase [Alteromonas sp. a30]MCY7294151.1 M23 family metallopeptidase [Alteromonas sp. a30]